MTPIDIFSKTPVKRDDFLGILVISRRIFGRIFSDAVCRITGDHTWGINNAEAAGRFLSGFPDSKKKAFLVYSRIDI